MERKLGIRFISEFALSTGIGDGHLADSTVARDHEGIPCLPGRAIKGALREGAWLLSRRLPRLGLERPLRILFGTRSQDLATNESGALTVSQGLLERGMRDILLGVPREERELQVRDLLTTRTQTALEPGKATVKRGSLRVIECGMPGLRFESRIEVDDSCGIDPQWLWQYLRCACAATKGMGSSRSRGLGICELTLEGLSGEPLVLPAAYKEA